MGAQFPIPILSVAADAVRDLEGRDALSGLWTLFSKCKESLQDGRRLENISWRLWYREMMLTNIERELSINEKLDASSQEKLYGHESPAVVDDKVFHPLTTPTDSAPNPPPYSVASVEGPAPPSMPQHQPHLPSDPTSPVLLSSSPAHFPSLSCSPSPSPQPSPSIPDYTRRPSISRSRRSSFFNGTSGTPINVGKIIFDMLPSSSSSTTSGDSNKGGMTAFFQPRPPLSHKSTSSTIASGSDIDSGKPDSDLKVPHVVSKLDPVIQMTPIEPSSSPKTQASSNVAGLAKLTKPDVVAIPIPVDVVSGLPTPEMEISEPTRDIIADQGPSISVLTIPSTSAVIPSDSISSNIPETPISSSNDQHDKLQHDLDQNSTSVYTGPPSPSLSDSYARAHPGEVEVKEVGLLPSLSVSNTLALELSPAQLQVDADESLSSDVISGNQTPSSSSTRIIAPIQTTFEEPPTLVVVNPTPNMTPHPTPPATPLMGGVIRSQWLTLPEGATGARQHQLLQAAQLQLPPQMTTLRLPAPSFGNSNVALTTVNGVAINRDFDRSRSATARASDSGTHVSPENTRTVLPESSQSNRRASPSSLKQQDQQDYQRSSSPSSCLDRQEESQSQRKDSPKRFSISSTTSSHISNSDHSSASGRADSTSTTDTTLSECDNFDTLAGLNSVEKAAMFEIRPAELGIGAAGHESKRPGSLSTIQSMSTLTDRRKEVGGGDVGANPVGDEEVIVEYAEEEDASPLSPLPPPGGFAVSPRSDKRRKRNSAPTLPTSSSTLLAVSPTPSGSSQIHASSPKSTTSASHSVAGKRKQITAGGGALTRRASSGRTTSRSHSAGGSSVGKSRSRSREPGVGGLGGLGMTQVAPPPPPVVAVAARKAPMVAGGRGRAKVVLGRAGSKAKGVMRRNSSGTGARSDNGAAEHAEQEQERERAEMESERMEKEHQEQLRMEALEKERERSFQVAEENRKVEELALAATQEREREREREAAERKMIEVDLRQRQMLNELTAGLFDIDEGASKRPVRFNIGSNSDEGGSKSAGSGSDLSGAHTKGKERQREDILPREQIQQQQQYQAPPQNQQLKEQQHFKQQPPRQLSKPELRQLQKMEQLHMQHQNQRIHPHPLQHQHQLQSQQQPQLGQEHYQPPSRQPSTKQINQVVGEGEREEGPRKGKGKGKEVAPAPLDRKTTKSTSKVSVALDPELAAKVQQSLAAPLLPQNRRKIVLATSESDFETDSDDDGSWSSEDMTGDDEDLTAQDEQLRLQHMHQQQQQQQQLQQQQQIQQQRQRQQQQQHAQVLQHQQQPARPQGVQRTQSSHYPAPNNNRNGRRNQQRNQGQVNAQAIIDAAAEAQRQREMFVKLPSSSFQNLATARTRSVGLLTQLMNPNPEIFPPNHPYRRGFSSSEIRPSGGAAAAAAPSRPLTAAALSTIKDSLTQPIPEEGSERSSQREKRSDASHDRKPSGAMGMPSRMNFSPPSRPGAMNRTKSAAAVPVSSQVAVGSIATKALPIADPISALPMTSNGMGTGSSSRIRLGPPPADAEMEDDSGSENEPGGISKSAAHEKLTILARKRGITANAHRNPELDQVHPPAAPAQTNGDDNEVPHWVVSQPQQQQRTRSNPQQRNGVQFVDIPDTSRPAPIPFGYPYNLPISAAPSTPRTTRRQMLSTELPESLRRNLLWERHGNLQAMRRSASGGGSRHNVLGGLQPMTPAPRMVQLHAKGTGPPESAINDDRGQRSPPPPVAGPSNAPGPAPNNDERRRSGVGKRNNTWANEFHFAGW